MSEYLEYHGDEPSAVFDRIECEYWMVVEELERLRPP